MITLGSVELLCCNGRTMGRRGRFYVSVDGLTVDNQNSYIQKSRSMSNK
jgi:hypothetical protein